MGTNKSLSKGLKAPGKALIDGIVAEMHANGVVPDAIEAVALRQAAVLADRQAELLPLIESDGVILVSPTGAMKTHPAALEHRAIAIAIARILSSVCLSDSSGDTRKSARHVRAGLASARANEKRHGNG